MGPSEPNDPDRLPAWARRPTATKPRSYDGAAVIDYLGFLYCTYVFVALVAPWLGATTTRPSYFVLLVALSVSMYVGERSRSLPEDRWHIDRQRLRPFIVAGRLLGAGVIALAACLVGASLLARRPLTIDHVFLVVGSAVYARLLIKFAPLAPRPNWKAGPWT